MTPHFVCKELNFPPENFLWANSKKKNGLKSLSMVVVPKVILTSDLTMCDSHCSFPAGSVPVKDLLRIETLLASVVKTFSGSAVKAEVSTWWIDALTFRTGCKGHKRNQLSVCQMPTSFGLSLSYFCLAEILGRGSLSGGHLGRFGRFLRQCEVGSQLIAAQTLCTLPSSFCEVRSCECSDLGSCSCGVYSCWSCFLVPICIAVFLRTASSAQMYRVWSWEETDTKVTRLFQDDS